MILAAVGGVTDWSTNPSVYIGTVLFLGMLAQWLAWRLKLPSILLLLIFGFLSGIFFEPTDIISMDLLFPLVALAVGIILFEGGLTLSFSELRETSVTVRRICTWGAVVTWALAGLSAWLIAGLPWQIAILLGAILVVTGPTVIIPLLRHLKLQRRISSVAKWEGIVIDPIGAVLAVLVLQGLLAGTMEGATFAAVTGILKSVLIGFGLALSVSFGLEFMLKRHWIPDYLHALVFLACGVIVFIAGNLLQSESGLVAVTVLGVRLANQKNASVKHVREFKENLRVVLISILFIVLAGLVDPADIMATGWRGFLFVVAVIVIVRPASIFLSTMKSGLSFQEKAFLCFMAPRGIVAASVSSIFALEIANAPFPEEQQFIQEAAAQLVPLTFAVIIGTVAFYGLAAGPAARRLKLASSNPQGVLFAGTPAWAIAAGKLLKKEGFHVMFVDTNPRGLARARMAGLATCNANILSEYISSDLELAGLGKLLAVTTNDEINTLATMEFRNIFGSRYIYQLSPASEASTSRERKNISSELRGRILFPGAPTGSSLVARAAQGEFRCTSLSETFTWEDLVEHHGGEVLPMFVVRDKSTLRVCTDETPDPEPGQSVVYMIPQAPEKVERESRSKTPRKKPISSEPSESDASAPKGG